MYWIQTQCMLLLGEQVLTIFLCINVYFLIWNYFVYDVQNATYSSHGAPCPARGLFPWLNTKVRVHIYVCRDEITEKSLFVTLGFWGYLVTIALSKTGYRFGVFHGWLHLHGLFRGARSGRFTKWKKKLPTAELKLTTLGLWNHHCNR